MSCSLGKKSNTFEKKIKSRQAFQGYKIFVQYNVSERGPYYQKCKFIYPLLKNPEAIYKKIETHCYQLKKISNNKKIILLHIENLYVTNKNKPSIIYSHKDREDLGKIYPKLIDYALMLKCDVISYDYSGYGLSEGDPTEKEVLSDIEQIVDFCLNNLYVKIENLILFGQSIGTLPSLYIGNMSKYCSIRGIILLDALCGEGNNSESKTDILQIASGVLCPVLLICGKLNTNVSSNESVILSEKLKQKYLWIPRQCDQHNISREYRYKFFNKIRKFLIYIENERYNTLHDQLDSDDERYESSFNNKNKKKNNDDDNKKFILRDLNEDKRFDNKDDDDNNKISTGDSNKNINILIKNDNVNDNKDIKDIKNNNDNLKIKNIEMNEINTNNDIKEI